LVPEQTDVLLVEIETAGVLPEATDMVMLFEVATDGLTHEADEVIITFTTSLFDIAVLVKVPAFVPEAAPLTCQA
jgi:hypothetical protein